MLLIVGIFAQDTTDILMDENKSITAHFRKIQYTLTTNVEPIGSGTISGAGTYDIGTTVTVEAIPASGYVFDHWNFGNNKWSGLGMNISPHEDFGDCVDTLLANGFQELRIYMMDFRATEWLADFKPTVINAIGKGAKVIWGLTGDDGVITATNWVTFRQGILDLAQWSQDNGVYEFSLGNEEESHIDNDTLTKTQLITNLKALATDVQLIFTNGKVSYACQDTSLSDWISAGKGDIDILASNIYMGGYDYYDDYWKTQITDMINAFGVDGTYLTEFAPSWTSLLDYSTDEAVQAEAVTEMIEYIKASGMTRAFYFNWKEMWGEHWGVVKADGTYRLLWNSLLNSN